MQMEGEEEEGKSRRGNGGGKEGGRQGKRGGTAGRGTPHLRQSTPPCWAAIISTYNLNVSFHSGLREHLIVLVFCLLSLFGSGMSFSFT